MQFDDSDLSKAIVIYVGYGITTYPKEEGSRLLSEFGTERAAELEARIKNILESLNQIKPDWNKHTLVSGSQWAVAELKKTIPGLDAKGTAALEWLYSWWWK
jgi:hypothetical protein